MSNREDSIWHPIIAFVDFVIAVAFAATVASHGCTINDHTRRLDRLKLIQDVRGEATP